MGVLESCTAQTLNCRTYVESGFYAHDLYVPVEDGRLVRMTDHVPSALPYESVSTLVFDRRHVQYGCVIGAPISYFVGALCFHCPDPHGVVVAQGNTRPWRVG